MQGFAKRIVKVGFSFLFLSVPFLSVPFLSVPFSAPAFAELAADDGEAVSTPLQSGAEGAGRVQEPIEIQAPRVANTDSIGTFSTPISQLRFEPLVDLQSRNLSEAQGDISIRGGIFTGTDLQLGAATIYDPQTGHYFAEIPLDPLMLSVPEIETGVDSAFSGFNSTSGSVRYRLMPITRKVETQFGAGSREFNLQRGYAAEEGLIETDQGSLNLDLSAARSESSGTRDEGRHEFARFSGRMQWKTDSSQTDFVGGYQEKDFKWPNLYVLQELHDAVESSGVESEALRSTLAFVNHRQEYGDNSGALNSEGSFVELSGYFRRQSDNYEFDVFNPGLFNPFEHTSKTWSGGIAGRHLVQSLSDAPVGIAVNYDGQYLYDDLESTALTFGDFSTRSYQKAALMPEWTMSVAELFSGAPVKAVLDTGVSYDGTNRDPSAVSPLVRLALVHTPEATKSSRAYLEYSKATRVPDYTSSNSNSAGGLFRGNQDLTRERSYNLEGGLDIQRGNYKNHSAVFYRRDLDLVDWTFDSSITPFASRSASNVDINTFGFEQVLEFRSKPADVVLGYTYLDKSEDYQGDGIDASFYALNFARHRFTLALTYRILEELHLKIDNEYRRQYENNLRAGTENPWLSYAALAWSPDVLAGLELSAVVDNPFKVNFQEVPGVPGEGRLAAVVATYRWE